MIFSISFTYVNVTINSINDKSINIEIYNATNINEMDSNISIIIATI